MRRLWRPRLVAAVLSVFVTATIAEAQAFVVRGAPAGANVEVTFGGKPLGTAIADPLGDARMPAIGLITPAVPEIVVHVAVDACDALRRIVLSERTGVVPPSGVGCTRSDVSGLYVVRRDTTVVIDIGRAQPSVLISQGPAPPAWTNAVARVVNPTGPGLTISAGVSFVGFRDVVPNFCGDITPCKASDYYPSYSLGARYWVNRSLAVDVGYVRSGDTRASGEGGAFTFDSRFNARIFSIGAAFGGPVGTIARVYGRAGFNRLDGVTTNRQTTEEIAVIMPDESLVTLKGGTNTLVHRVGGWSLIVGLGTEVWFKPPFGFYIEGAFAPLKGKDLDGGEAEIDDRSLMLLAGGRIYLGQIFRGRWLR